MKKYFNKIILVTFISIFIIIARTANAYASLQANKGGTSKVNTTASDFFTLIKGMEIGTIGKASQNAEDGIDCHMAKNTEWGSVAILAACSNFGVIPTEGTTNSTTGNESGIYQMAGNKYEYTANIINGTTKTFASNITNAAPKYKNVYANGGTRISGDALNFGTQKSYWEVNYPVMFRGSNSLFQCGYPNNFSAGNSDSNVGSRATIVNGTGL